MQRPDISVLEKNFLVDFVTVNGQKIHNFSILRYNDGSNKSFKKNEIQEVCFCVHIGPYTEYKIQVAAFTGGGRGKFSEKYPALTDVAGKTHSPKTLSYILHCQTIYTK